MTNKELTTIIPAQAGWFVLSPSMYEGNEEEFEKTDLDPVVAWQVTTFFNKNMDDFSSATPITVGGLCSKWMVVCPNGTVTDPEIAQYKNIEGAIKDIRAQYKERPNQC